MLIGRKAGLDDSEIERCKTGAGAEGWTDTERLLISAAEELHAHNTITEATWTGLAEHYETLQLMDIVFAVGQYTLIAYALNAFGTPLDDGLGGF